MEAERTRDRTDASGQGEGYPVADAPPSAPAEKDAGAGKLATNLSRCPYCHADVHPEASDWVACAGCLARHHQGCWNEHGSCASCHGRETLARKRGRFLLRREVVGLLVLVPVLLISAIGVFAIERAERARSPVVTEWLPVAAHDLHEGDVVGRNDVVLLSARR